MGVLDKVRPNLPVKPLPDKKPKIEIKEEKVVRGTKPVPNTKNAVKPKVIQLGSIKNILSNNNIFLGCSCNCKADIC